MKLSNIKTAINFYPLAPKRQQIAQAVRLEAAKDYLTSQNIYSIKQGNAFKYVPVLGKAAA